MSKRFFPLLLVEEWICRLVLYEIATSPCFPKAPILSVRQSTQIQRNIIIAVCIHHCVDGFTHFRNETGVLPD